MRRAEFDQAAQVGLVALGRLEGPYTRGRAARGRAARGRVAGGRVRVLLHLLAPNQRPQQVTEDLASFWKNTYPQIRKELRIRYPKHAWPEDPWNAPAESRPKKKM